MERVLHWHVSLWDMNLSFFLLKEQVTTGTGSWNIIDVMRRSSLTYLIIQLQPNASTQDSSDSTSADWQGIEFPTAYRIFCRY
jgi:hypothetical protein